MVVRPVNVHDTILFDRSFTNLLELADLLNLDLSNSYVTLDSGFHSEFNKSVIEQAGLTAVIKPNIGARKDREKIWISVNAHAIRDTGGHLSLIEGILEDITYQKEQ